MATWAMPPSSNIFKPLRISRRCLARTSRWPVGGRLLDSLGTHKLPTATQRRPASRFPRQPVTDKEQSIVKAQLEEIEKLSGEVQEWIAKRQQQAENANAERTTDAVDLAFLHVTIGSLEYFIRDFIREIWPYKRRYQIRDVSEKTFQDMINALQANDGNAIILLLELFFFLSRRSGLFNYDFTVRLVSSMASYQARHGGVEFRYLDAALNLRNVVNNIPTTATIKSVRKTLASIEQQDGPLSWRALVMAGLLEEHAGDPERAMALLIEAVPAALTEAKEPRSPESVAESYELGSFQSRQSQLAQLDEKCAQYVQFAVPWTCGVNLILRSRSNPNISAQRQAALFENALPLIEQGMKAEDARAYYLAALPEQAKYEQEQMTDTYDEELGDTRLARDPDNIGKCSKRLYRLTKAAASGQPDAQMELGEYYWKTPHRHLDDEPPDELKPTPLDRWPGKTHKFVGNLQFRLLDALGLAGLFGHTSPKTTTDDMFIIATLPGAAEERARLAYRWLKSAADAYYAPALKSLIEIVSSEFLPVDLGVPKQRSVPYKKKLDYHNAVFRGEEQSYSMTAISQDTNTARPDATSVSTSSSRIKNPMFDEEEAKRWIAQAYYAINTRGQWESFRKTYKVRHGRHTVQSQSARNLFKRHLEGKTSLSYEEAEPWLRYPDIYDLWHDDTDQVDALSRYCEDLIKAREWEIRDESGKLRVSISTLLARETAE